MSLLPIRRRLGGPQNHARYCYYFTLHMLGIKTQFLFRLVGSLAATKLRVSTNTLTVNWPRPVTAIFLFSVCKTILTKTTKLRVPLTPCPKIRIMIVTLSPTLYKALDFRVTPLISRLK